MKRVTLEESEFYIKLPTEKKDKADAFVLFPDENGWDRVQYLANAILDPSGAVRPTEYVYVLVNKTVPNMVKVGMTTTTPQQRAKDISRATGVVEPWIPVYEFKCYRSDLLEREVHEYLHEWRVVNNREMFEIDSYTAQAVIEKIGYKYSTARWDHSDLDLV
jgi:hypothetical protein